MRHSSKTVMDRPDLAAAEEEEVDASNGGGEGGSENQGMMADPENLHALSRYTKWALYTCAQLVRTHLWFQIRAIGSSPSHPRREACLQEGRQGEGREVPERDGKETAQGRKGQG